MKKHMGRLVVVILLLGTLFSFFYFGLYQYFNLEYLKSQQDNFQNYYEQSPLITILIFMAIYIVSTALSLPGAALLTLLGGALFGLFMGTIVVSFASTIGATLAFLVARFLLREWVQTKFSKSLDKLNKGVREEGNFYLFTLRLIPIVPFFVINLVMGLTPMRTLSFFIVSQIGMLPGTMVFVNAGTELAKIEAIGDILSFRLWLSFALLGIFPILMKKIMSYVNPKKSEMTHG